MRRPHFGAAPPDAQEPPDVRTFDELRELDDAAAERVYQKFAEQYATEFCSEVMYASSPHLEVTIRYYIDKLDAMARDAAQNL